MTEHKYANTICASGIMTFWVFSKFSAFHKSQSFVTVSDYTSVSDDIIFEI